MLKKRVQARMFSGLQGGGTPGGRCCQAASPPPPCIVPPTYQLCRLWTKYTTLSAISTTCNTTCAVCFTLSLSHMANTSLIFLLFALVSSMLGSAFPMNRIQMSIARCCACVAFQWLPYADEQKSPPIQRGNPKPPSNQCSTVAFSIHRRDDMLLLIVLQHRRPHRRDSQPNPVAASQISIYPQIH